MGLKKDLADSQAEVARLQDELTKAEIRENRLISKCNIATADAEVWASRNNTLKQELSNARKEINNLKNAGMQVIGDAEVPKAVPIDFGPGYATRPDPMFSWSTLIPPNQAAARALQQEYEGFVAAMRRPSAPAAGLGSAYEEGCTCYDCLRERSRLEFLDAL